MKGRDSARRLHQSTKHGTPPAEPETLVPYRRLDPANAPTPFKRYRGLESIPLPRDLVVSSLPANSVLSGEKGESRPMDARFLSTILFAGAGVTRQAGAPGRRSYFRTAMSAGNLHPVEVYVITGDVKGIPPGVYHFSPLEVSLTRLRRGDHLGRIGAETALAVVLTGIPWRTAWKYGERGWRHLYWDGGTMLANMLAVADANGIENVTALGFDDRLVMELLGIHGTDEVPLAVVYLGPAGYTRRADTELEHLSPDTDPAAPRPLRLPLLVEAQTDSSLRSDEVERWRERGAEVADDAPDRVDHPEQASDAPIEEVVLWRGSTRRMLRQAIRREEMEWPLAASTRSVGLDVVPGGTLLDHYVNIHAVDGLEEGAYRHTFRGAEPIRQLSSIRGVSAELCLGQALGGDSAYTVFHCADLDPLLDSLGPRGYRVAQLEAGVVSGRLALCAFALGLGATGLTFYDDAVSDFFGTSAQPMLVTAVGVPSTAPAPAGAPGEPVTLRR